MAVPNSLIRIRNEYFLAVKWATKRILMDLLSERIPPLRFLDAYFNSIDDAVGDFLNEVNSAEYVINHQQIIAETIEM